MLKQQPYPWTLKEEDIPSSLQARPIASSASPKRFLMAGVLVLAGLLLTIGWLGAQYVYTAPNFHITLNPNDLPHPSTSKLVIMPSPIRYNLLNATPMEHPDLLKNILSLPKPSLPPGSMVSSAGLNPGTTPLPPPSTVSLSSPPIAQAPSAPAFRLIGTAQGMDGAVATLRISGDKEDTTDVRQGETLNGGYTVMQIAPEYVILKNKKDGKTIRVE